MKNWEKTVAPAGFALAGVLFLFAALKPAMAGQGLNAAFLVIGLAFLVLGIVFLRKRGDTSPPNE